MLAPLLNDLLTEIMRYPAVAISLVLIIGVLQAWAWYRILKKTELPAGYVLAGSLCALGAIFFGPLMLVPLAIAALVPWPVSQPPYLKRRSH
ncbi:MAG: hypothetical protein F6K00_27125 [Leptolyngbya sp. SIOISBB]|nr:hypothetical protein [Leptolyngbya sp. SIOISBB]